MRPVHDGSRAVWGIYKVMPRHLNNRPAIMQGGGALDINDRPQRRLEPASCRFEKVKERDDSHGRSHSVTIVAEITVGWDLWRYRQPEARKEKKNQFLWDGKEQERQ